jgi:molybdopterin-guanine dinucleotide biosynthesis protein A
MLSIVIQAGGESRRMGADKALRSFQGRPLILRVIERLAPLADELIVTTNHPEEYEFLDARLIPDAFPGRGALGGLYTALSAASLPIVAVAACDMPFVSQGLLQAQAAILQAEEPAPDAVIPMSDGGIEPFHAVYRRGTCLPAVLAALSAGKWRVDSWFSEARIRYLSPDEVARHDPDRRAFWNVNTPEEFAAAEERARGEGTGKPT